MRRFGALNKLFNCIPTRFVPTTAWETPLSERVMSRRALNRLGNTKMLKPYLNLVSQLEIAVRRTPNNPERWYQLGRLHAQYGRFEKAIVPLQRSIELNPHDWKVFNILSVCYMRLNQFDKMEETCKAAVRLAPNEANVHNSLGMSYFLQRKYHEAMDSFETTVGLNGENPEFRENLAKAYEALGKADKPQTNAKRHNDSEKNISVNRNNCAFRWLSQYHSGSTTSGIIPITKARTTIVASTLPRLSSMKRHRI